MNIPTSNNPSASRPIVPANAQVTTNAPRYRVQLDRIAAAAFFNAAEDGRTSQGSVVLSKRYFDQKTSEWKTQRLILFPSELAAVIVCLDKVQQLLVSHSPSAPAR